MITSTKNSGISLVRKLNKDASFRREQGLFAAEGKRLVFDIIGSGFLPRILYYTEDFYSKNKEIIPGGIEREPVADHVMESMCETKTPQGVVGVFEIPVYNINSLINKDSPLMLVLSGIRDPGNLGTIFRTFEACGGDGIILLKGTSDPFSPKCIRSTMGSIVRMPYFHCRDAAEFYKLAEKIDGLSIYGADMEGTDYINCDFTGASAFVIGNEASGIDRDMMALVNRRVSIPMAGKVESLNAAVSSAILGFEAMRQRRIL